MNIKLEIDGKKYEIAIIDYTLPMMDYEEWGYEVFDISGDAPVWVGDETDYGDLHEAACAGFSHLVQILTNEDHSTRYTEKRSA